MNNWDMVNIKAKKNTWVENLGRVDVYKVQIRFKGQKQIDVEVIEDIHFGGIQCSFTENVEGSMQNFENDLVVWAEKNGFYDFEIEDLKNTWVDWYLNRKDFGVLSKDYLTQKLES